jgi:pimeloyl-ACP methyl ester carboxylesterase
LTLAACVPPPLQPPSRQLELTFDVYTPLASNAEMARRTATPLTAQWRIAQLRATGAALRAPIDLTQEKFDVYIPAGPPPAAGYGLLVFVPPWDEPTRIPVWHPALDRHHLILVSARKSGNDARILDRRLPLALLAYANATAEYRIDPERVYVGGFSGGSRVAEIAAMAYPDVFRAVMLNAGSDPIGGEAGMYLPPADLFRMFQRRRIVFVTGERDEYNVRDDWRSRDSLTDYCVFDVAVAVARGLGHEALDRQSLEKALVALDQRPEQDAGRVEKCNARLEAAAAAKAAEVDAAITRQDRDGARSLLKELDARYSGLAAPALYELDARLRALK